MPVHIHHFTLSCENPTDTCQQFCEKFAFRQFAICRERKGVKIAAKITDEIIIVFEERPSTARHDTVYDVALAMDNLTDRYTKAVNNGADFIQPLTRITDQNGYVDYAIVKVPVGNIQHTLLDMSHYHGQFLPGYQPVTQDEPVNVTDHRLTHIDHITCVCYQDTTIPLLQWYQRCFNFTRFTINADEEDDGYRLRDLHIKMIAAQYWLCAEQGIQSLNGHFKFILAEPLDMKAENHVTGFLQDQEGPGIQHIAFYSESIVDSISKLKASGVAFIRPPDPYYDGLKQAGIQKIIQLTVEELQESNTLLDSEIDEDNSYIANGHQNTKFKYLLQSFTQPLLDKRRSFFLEIIQRFGAKGFGGRNIRKLFTAMENYEKMQDN